MPNIACRIIPFILAIRLSVLLGLDAIRYVVGFPTSCLKTTALSFSFHQRALHCRCTQPSIQTCSRQCLTLLRHDIPLLPPPLPQPLLLLLHLPPPVPLQLSLHTPIEPWNGRYPFRPPHTTLCTHSHSSLPKLWVQGPCRMRTRRKTMWPLVCRSRPRQASQSSASTGVSRQLPLLTSTRKPATFWIRRAGRQQSCGNSPVGFYVPAVRKRVVETRKPQVTMIGPTPTWESWAVGSERARVATEEDCYQVLSQMNLSPLRQMARAHPISGE